MKLGILMPRSSQIYEVGRVADIGVGAHEYRASRDGEQSRGERAHQLLRVATSEIEEREIGRRIVKEARQYAGQPEIGCINRPFIVGGNQAEQRGKWPVVAGLQHGQHRDHGDEDGGE